MMQDLQIDNAPKTYIHTMMHYYVCIGYPPLRGWLWAYTSRGKISRGRSPRLICPRDVYAHNHALRGGYPAYTTVPSTELKAQYTGERSVGDR